MTSRTVYDSPGQLARTADNETDRHAGELAALRYLCPPPHQRAMHRGDCITAFSFGLTIAAVVLVVLA